MKEEEEEEEKEEEEEEEEEQKEQEEQKEWGEVERGTRYQVLSSCQMRRGSDH